MFCVREFKFDTNDPNEKLMNAAKCQGYIFYRSETRVNISVSSTFRTSTTWDKETKKQFF